MSVSRRQFLVRSAALTASVVAFPGVLGAAGADKLRPGRKPRRIIHLVSDGMSLGTLTCADYFSQLTRGRPLTWIDLYRRPAAQSAWVNMRSLNSTVTDSAAASSSWGSGSRVKNGTLNVLPDGRALRPLCTLFGEAGWMRGLVTTTEITHATPAGFAANLNSRDDANAIAVQYLDRQVDVLLGGGAQFFDPAKRKDKRDLKADFRQRGYVVVQNRQELADAPANRRWLGVFARSHLPFTLDHLNSESLQASVPTLAEMTRAALRQLAGAKHFLLQIEGGRVDHAAHASDAPAAMRDQVAFDEAIEVCLEFQRREPDTLLVITTDHGNSNLGLNGTGTNYEKSPRCFARLADAQKSFPELLKDFKKAAGLDLEKDISDADTLEKLKQLAPDRVSELIEEATGYAVPQKKAEAFLRFVAGLDKPLYDGMNSLSTQLGQLLANHYGVGWTGNSHTADYVPLVAVGPGAERFRGFLQNTDVFAHYLALAGIRFQNPAMPLMAESAPTAAEVERWQIA
jgi:alkaline phosphatase